MFVLKLTFSLQIPFLWLVKLFEGFEDLKVVIIFFS